MPIPSSCSKIFWPLSNLFDHVNYFLNAVKNMIFPYKFTYLSKIFECIQKILRVVNFFQTKPKMFWTSRGIKQEIWNTGLTLRDLLGTMVTRYPRVILGRICTTKKFMCKTIVAGPKSRAEKKPKLKPRKTYQIPCKICMKIFNRKDNLKQHIKSVHERKKPHKCEKCSRQFAQKSHLSKHQKNKHK